MYRYNPHQQVKIWLSKYPDVFLNPENQLRFVKIRVTNPHE
jgi:glucosyltransferase Lgt1/2/3